jgi:hypothetical protein
VIAVNGTYGGVQATIRVPGLGTRALSVLDEGRKVLASADVFSDGFGPLGVHVYIASPAS